MQYHFDESLGVGCKLGSGEESDITAQILENHKKCIYDDSIIVFHHTGESKYDIDMERHIKYCRGFGGLCAKHIYEIKNKYFYCIYYKKNVRTRIGLILSYLKRDKYLQTLYKTTLKSRKEGFLEYKSMVIGDK